MAALGSDYQIDSKNRKGFTEKFGLKLVKAEVTAKAVLPVFLLFYFTPKQHVSFFTEQLFYLFLTEYN